MEPKRFNLTNYLSSIFNYIMVSSILFLSFMFIGYLFYGIVPMHFPIVVEPFKEIISFFQQLTPVEQFLFIFLNNSIKGLLNIILGPILGIYPFLFIVFNGFVIGFTSALIASEKGLSFTLISLVPHGVIEIPAVVICNAIGFKLAVETIKAISGKSKLSVEFKNALKAFAYLVLPLLLLAAFIEVFVTSNLINLCS